jgi:hypothetical protein
LGARAKEMKYVHLLVSMVFWWNVQFAAKVFFVFSGLLMSIFVVRDAEHIENPAFPRTSMWSFVNIRKNHWLWIYGNDRDGLDGDKYGKYLNWWRSSLMGKLFPEHGGFYHYWWSAIRNPANNLRFARWNACDIRECDFTTYGSNPMANNKENGKGWQLTIGKSWKTDRYYFGFTAWFPYGFKKYGLLIKLGNKINFSHTNKEYLLKDELKNFKGTAFYANPFQDY